MLWNALVEKHQAQIERWCTEISRRAALKRMDEEAGRPQVWGTAAAEEAEVTKGLGSFKWKMWLSLDATHDRRTRCWEKWLALMADHCLPEQMRLLCHGYNTCLLESFHSSRLALTPKSVSFWVSYEARARLAALRWNRGHRCVADVAAKMQLELTQEEMAELQRMDARKDREAHRRQRPEMRRRLAMKSKEAEMRMRSQQLLVEQNSKALREQKKREESESRRWKGADEREDDGAASTATPGAEPDVASSPPSVPCSQPLPLPASSSPSPARRVSSSPRSASAVHQCPSVRYKSPAEKQQPFPTSVEAALEMSRLSVGSRRGRKRRPMDAENAPQGGDHRGPAELRAGDDAQTTKAKDAADAEPPGKRTRTALRELNMNARHL